MTFPVTIAALHAAYRRGALTPRQLATHLADRLDAEGADVAWIARQSRADLLAEAQRIEAAFIASGRNLQRFALYGVPFAIKDNIDAADFPTTAACPAFAYQPKQDAEVVRRLRAAGALLVGKTNLDQFATGLTGTRSPYGAVPNTFDAQYISGGSSSGSASLVARGLVSFALGTDTAGSGRVPAGFNNIVGLKPTRGLISTRGVLPACRSLDCVSILALTVDDAQAVLAVAEAWDEDDAYSRRRSKVTSAPLQTLRVGIPDKLEFYGDAKQQAAFSAALKRAEHLRWKPQAIAFAPFLAAAQLLYDGPWVAQRLAAMGKLLASNPGAIHPVVKSVAQRGADYSALQAFEASHRLAELARKTEALWRDIDVLLLPTAPTIYRIDAVNADALRLNANLGYYTNFVNLLDLAALAVPDSLRDDGLPAGVTFVAPAWSEALLCAIGKRWQRATDVALGATTLRLPVVQVAEHTQEQSAVLQNADSIAPGMVRVAVVGAHLSGMPLNGQLIGRDATLVGASTTSSSYRLYALPGSVPPKPGLVRTRPGAGLPIALELWDMPVEHFGSFVAAIPAPLGIGSIELADGGTVKGFVCESYALEGARDISTFGGWRAFLASEVAV